MLKRSEMNYSQMVIADLAEEHPNVFMCGTKSLNKMKEKAEKDAARILQEFKQFYSGDFSIEIIEVEHLLCWSVGAILKVNGETVKTYNYIDLLFVELNELMLKRLIEARREKRDETNT